MDKSPEQLTSEKIRGPGSQLREERQAKGIEVAEVARQLRLSPQRVIEIEEDNYSHFGAPTFARGSLRAYARLVGFAESDILKQFEEMELAKDITSTKPKLLPLPRESGINIEKLTKTFVYLVVLGVIGMAIFWGVKHDGFNKVTNMFKPASATTNIALPKQQIKSTSTSTSTSMELPLQSVTTEKPALPTQNTTEEEPDDDQAE